MRRRLAALLAVPLLLLVVAAGGVLEGVTGAGDLVLCDGQTYTVSPVAGELLWPAGKPALKLDAGKDARLGDPAIRKVIRDCTFRDSPTGDGARPAIVIVSARNVLITGSTFLRIRTGVPGNGVHAIAIPGSAIADGIAIEQSIFRDIAADGLQIGDGGPNVRNLRIVGNTFVAPAAGGENAIDIKGTAGPTLISANIIGGYRPCSADCSGSQGAGIVIHDNPGLGTRPQDVTVSDNRIHDNTRGVTLAQVDRASVVRNDFCANLEGDVILGTGNGAYTVADNTSCAGMPDPSSTPAPSPSDSVPGPSPSPSAAPTPAPTPSPSLAPTPAPTASPVSWWCAWFPGLC